MIRTFGGAVLAAALAGTALGAAPWRGAAQGAFSDNAIRIGILNDQSGLYAEYGGQGSVEAARMAVEDMGGKIGSVPIEILSADHQNKPDIASAIARQWYDRDNVDAIMELTTSSVALAVQGLSKEKKKITITTGAATSDLTGKACSPYGYHWAFDTRALAVGTGGALTRAGGNTWFFLTADYAFGSALEADTSKVVLANGGKVVGSVRHPLVEPGLLVVPAPGAGLEGQGDRARQCRARHLERDQAGGGVRHRRGRPEARGPAVHPVGGARASASRSRRG